jgi:hypothetical protein
VIRPLILALLAALPAAAQTPAPPVSWWADNPVARNRILDICREHPGPAERDDRCKAAAEGSAVAAAREARATRGDHRTKPSTEQYWVQRPEERREHLATCSRVPAEIADQIWCDQARKAEERAQQAQPLPQAPQQNPRVPRRT